MEYGRWSHGGVISPNSCQPQKQRPLRCPAGHSAAFKECCQTCRCLRLLYGALQAIRRESDSRALVLLDEVGTGTDPGEGAALGVALLHALIRGGFGGASFTMATTHHRCLFMLTIHGAFGSL